MNDHKTKEFLSDVIPMLCVHKVYTICVRSYTVIVPKKRKLHWRASSKGVSWDIFDAKHRSVLQIIFD